MTGTITMTGVLFTLAVLAVGMAAVVPLSGRQKSWDEPAEDTEAEQIGLRKRTLIVGAGAAGHALARELESDGRYHIVGFVDVDDEQETHTAAPSRDSDWPILGPRALAPTLVRQHGIAEVFLAPVPSWQQEFMSQFMTEQSSVTVRVVPSFFDAMLCTGNIDSVGDAAVIPVMTAGETAFDRSKRVVETLVSAGALLLLAPLMALVALLVRATSPGPALFVQERVGLGGRPFQMLKFRTMRTDAESATGPVLSAGKDDRRLTPIGRWLRLVRLDEVPQLINVLRGDMSLVGPRPERPIFVEEFEARDPLYARRHDVRPGITGLAQAHAGYHTDARDKLRFDLFYISHRSFWMDLSILWRTVVLSVYSPNGK